MTGHQQRMSDRHAWTRAAGMADEAGVRLAGVSPEFPSAVTVACADCERSFEVWVGEERAFYRFHRCGTDRRPDE